MPRFSANLGMLFTEVDFVDRFAAAARAGFHGVEYPLPYDHDKDVLAGELRRHDLAQVLFNLPAGDWDAGERGIACHPDRVGEFREGVERAIEYAAALGCGRVNCLAGIAPVNADPGRLRETFIDNLVFAADRLSREGIALLIEPINTRDMPGFFLNGSVQAVEIMDDVGSANLALQYDVYHMQVMEGDLAPTIERLFDRIGHFQVADNPGRHEPGTGEINYPFLFDRIDGLGYRDWIGCEYKPASTTLEGLHWLRPYLSERE